MEGSEGKEAVSGTRNGNLVFAVNGQRFEVPEVHPSTTLLEFLRNRTRFKSAKLSCGQGGCGACVVLLSKYDPVLKKVEDFSVSSCLTLLCSVNGCSITTSDGLGNSKDGFHPIHLRFAGFHASQCGFCTPGMCMSFFAALVNAEKTDRPEPPPGFSKLTVSEAEKSISGNLCRCTGYRPIADACKSFAADVDIEDLGFNSFGKNGDLKEVKVRRLPSYNPNDKVCTYPEFLKGVNSGMFLDFRKYSWYSPVSLDDLRSLLANLIKDGKQFKLVVGNTGTGYYEELELVDRYIDLRHIPQLSTIRRNHLELEIGATVTISRVISCLKDDELDLCPDSKLVFQKLAEHMEKVATPFVRNSGSIGGNLVIAQRNHFPSDIATILLGVGSTVSIATGNKEEKITLEEFLAAPPLDSRSVLIGVQLPILEPKGNGKTSGAHYRFLFETYRAATRPLGNALAYLNAAFLADVSCSSSGVLVNNIRLAFGAFGTKHAIRARNVEEYLSGKTLSVVVLFEAVNLVKEAVIPEAGTSYPAYRKSLATSFLFQFLSPYINIGFIGSYGLPRSPMYSSQEKAAKNDKQSYFHDLANSKILNSGKQEVESSREYAPVGEPLPKYLAALQASGEAVFVDDIPTPPDCLHGSFIYSTKPLAWVKGVDIDKDAHKGVFAVLSYKDIPEGGENIGSQFAFGSETLFAEDITQCAGERIAFVAAETQKCADIAAKTALVYYSTENLEPPILTVEEAVEHSSFFEVPPSLYPEQVGDFAKGMAEADHKIYAAELKFSSENHFYMETQTALAIPDENNCMVVYSSTQNPEYAQSTIAKCLGVPEHNIRVITRRVGGGYGGKATRSMPVATACALAAYQLRRPVRTYLDREIDMVITGGRPPMKITYDVGFKSDGKITALHLYILINAGISVDTAPLVPNYIIRLLKKYNWGALSFDIKVCKTNHTTKTIMRGPGELQGSFIADVITEHVASMLSMDVDCVRHKNLHTFESLKVFYGDSAGEALEYTLPDIWNKLDKSSSLEQRIQAIEKFNSSNRWSKRGISRIPIVYEVDVRPNPGKVGILWDGTIVVEVGGIELGQGLWTKVRQVAAYALSSIASGKPEDLLEKIRSVQSDTLSLVQGGYTAGSTTSESSCAAVLLCCDILVERLIPFKKKLEEQLGPINWDDLIQQAHDQNVNLQANAYYVPDSTSVQYLNYGAAVSEVEIDILTGETKILQSDIIYDCGESMNPAVDLGQIEGSFVQGIGFFMSEEYLINSEGLAVMKGTWSYQIPTLDTIPKQFNVEVLNSGHHKKRVLSSKASGEPPLLLAATAHCATRAAIKEARKELKNGDTDPAFQLEVPAIMPVVKTLCGLDSVEKYLEGLLSV